jgi:hypothetical protein
LPAFHVDIERDRAGLAVATDPGPNEPVGLKNLG